MLSASQRLVACCSVSLAWKEVGRCAPTFLNPPQRIRSDHISIHVNILYRHRPTFILKHTYGHPPASCRSTSLLLCHIFQDRCALVVRTVRNFERGGVGTKKVRLSQWEFGCVGPPHPFFQRYALFVRVLSCCHSAPIFPFPHLLAHRGWKQTNEVTLKGAPYQASECCSPPHPPPPRLVYLICKPPYWITDHSVKPPAPSFPVLHCSLQKPAVYLKAGATEPQSRCFLNKKNLCQVARSSSRPLSSVSGHLESHLGFPSSGSCLSSARWANKEKEESQSKRARESEDVLIKGNSEGLNQIILHNLIREDTAFDTEKMEMTRPQIPVLSARGEDVAEEAARLNHGVGSQACLHAVQHVVLCTPACRWWLCRLRQVHGFQSSRKKQKYLCTCISI